MREGTFRLNRPEDYHLDIRPEVLYAGRVPALASAGVSPVAWA
jgi:hypothetical protein